jgi:hypothetical protein
MPIVNQYKVTEDNPKDHKTIDTDTGIYITVTEERPFNPPLYSFLLVDGDFEILFECPFREKEYGVNSESGLRDIDVVYSLHSFLISGTPKKRNYLQIFKDLLAVHGRYYRIGEKKFKVNTRAVLEYSPEIEEKILKKTGNQASGGETN